LVLFILKIVWATSKDTYATKLSMRKNVIALWY